MEIEFTKQYKQRINDSLTVCRNLSILDFIDYINKYKKEGYLKNKDIEMIEKYYYSNDALIHHNTNKGFNLHFIVRDKKICYIDSVVYLECQEVILKHIIYQLNHCYKSTESWFYYLHYFKKFKKHLTPEHLIYIESIEILKEALEIVSPEASVLTYFIDNNLTDNFKCIYNFDWDEYYYIANLCHAIINQKYEIANYLLLHPINDIEFNFKNIEIDKEWEDFDEYTDICTVEEDDWKQDCMIGLGGEIQLIVHPFDREDDTIRYIFEEDLENMDEEYEAIIETPIAFDYDGMITPYQLRGLLLEEEYRKRSEIVINYINQYYQKNIVEAIDKSDLRKIVPWHDSHIITRYIIPSIYYNDIYVRDNNNIIVLDDNDDLMYEEEEDEEDEDEEEDEEI